MTDTTQYADATLDELALALAGVTALLDQAAETTSCERDTALAHAKQAADAKLRGAELAAADHASAADNAASRARRAAITAGVQEQRAWHIQVVLDPEHGNRQAADDDEPTPARRAWTAADKAEQAARVACSGIDWLRFHLDGHCRHWRERVADGATPTAA